MTNRDYAKEQSELQAAIKRFPATFGLRAYPDGLFRVGIRESFVDDNGQPKLYTQRLVDGKWLDFAKGTEDELAGQLAPTPEWSERHERLKAHIDMYHTSQGFKLSMDEAHIEKTAAARQEANRQAEETIQYYDDIHFDLLQEPFLGIFRETDV